MWTVIKTDTIIPVLDRYRAVFDGLDVDFREVASETEDALIANCQDADALLVLKEPITARVLNALPKLKIVSRFGAGLDNIDVDAARKAGIAVASVPDASTDEVATHAVAMILALVRRLPRYDRSIRDGRWSALAEGRDIRRASEMVVGIVGLGRIGSSAARKLAAFGFRLWGYDPVASDEAFAAAGIERKSLDEIVIGADVVSLHVPLTPQTSNLFDAARLDAMKPGAILVNVSRGGLVDDNHLGKLLSEGKLAGAGLDAFQHEPLPADSPLRDAPNLLMSPHAAFCSQEAFHDVCFGAFDQVAKACAAAA
jgi:D-3-phosphoglycerate dehydrogenase